MLNLAVRIAGLILPVLASTAVTPTPAAPGRLPFQVGERLTYDAKVNSLRAGKATLSVE